MNEPPSGVSIASVIGLKSRRPVSAYATQISGLPMNARVSGLPSLRFGKLRLNEVRIEFCSPFSMSSRFHWPMHGPQAFASTTAPISSSASSWPSRRIVLWICSEPGVHQSFVAAFTPFSVACRATSAARVRSSYEEFVQLPIRHEVRFVG